ncbi:origin recognition complex subunit 2 [Blastomyces dermatitidis ER-3]|uniref:Origin recognition complex subunit 2 n=1 Tax=Ajellomyces dermatitidis (strain ER-3 / ATCC MYA-2586) TaxID=559297 RepID=A0ABP2EQR2_AJEDR|nr:origin recognition complex subunit 2 [Blastomyces dermatitidis ER-3]EEQ85966.2 origin recognition complex subunit 2 [Blastomyces dermatitidis ER-3]
MTTMKRKQPDSSKEEHSIDTTPRKRRTTTDPDGTTTGIPQTPSRKPNSTRNGPKTKPTPDPNTPTNNSSVPKTQSRSLFATPTKATGEKATDVSPSVARNANRSAKRKSARVLLEHNDEDDWDGADQLAQAIWEPDDDDAEAEGEDDKEEEKTKKRLATKVSGAAKTQDTPKRRAGRPKGAKNRRSPTPEGDLPPHERYFFQNRPGPVQTSNNTLAKLSLLTHEEYFEQMSKFVDPHQKEKEFLLELHEHSFPQWAFELSEGFNICLYGYGSKRRLVNRFAEWLSQQHSDPPTIVIVNGYVSSTTIRSILSTIINAILGPDTPSKLGMQPSEVLELLQSILNTNPPPRPIMVFINSIDASPLRRPSHQALLARLASIPLVNILATADTPNFPLLWDVSHRDQFNFVFHDCTTFASYDVELNVVDEVNNLLGRQVRRIGGKDGVNFVLKSLPENTRKLYRLLLTEILTLLSEQHVSEDEDNGDGDGKKARGVHAGEEIAIEWRTLFHKAAEEFISSSEMMFRTQLKEFYDHQMIVSRTDASGVEMLGIPLSREEMEGVLEDLIID